MYLTTTRFPFQRLSRQLVNRVNIFSNLFETFRSTFYNLKIYIFLIAATLRILPFLVCVILYYNSFQNGLKVISFFVSCLSVNLLLKNARAHWALIVQPELD